MCGDEEHTRSQLEQKMASSSLGQLLLSPGCTEGLYSPAFFAVWVWPYDRVLANGIRAEGLGISWSGSFILTK